MDSATALLIADLVGVAVFAASGGSAGVAKRLDVPLVLRREIYAVAAVVGSAVVAVGHRLGAPDLTLLITAAVITFAIRMFAVLRGWSAPTAPFGGDR